VHKPTKAESSNLQQIYLGAFVILMSLIWFSPEKCYAQSEIIPAIKVAKKKKKAEKPTPSKKPIRVKDRYRRPPSTSGSKKAIDSYKPPRSMKTTQGGIDSYQPPKTIQKPGRIFNQYRQPPSQRVKYNNQPGKDNQLEAPLAEEGGTVERPSIWQRLFNRKKATIYAGSQKYESATPSVGILHSGEIQYKPTDHQKISKTQHQHQGNIRKAPPKLVEKQFSYKALYMSNYQGNMKVLKPDRQEKQRWANASELQQAGIYKIKREKDKAANYTTFYKQLKAPKPQAKTRNFEKLSAKVHQYEGNLRIRKPEKDMHPSVYYLKSKTKNSYEEKEKYRRWRLVITHIFDKSDQPKHTKEKPRKPRYDKDESEIWYY
jgi:hypothetical protein